MGQISDESPLNNNLNQDESQMNLDENADEIRESKRRFDAMGKKSGNYNKLLFEALGKRRFESIGK